MSTVYLSSTRAYPRSTAERFYPPSSTVHNSWTGQIALKGVRLENYKGELLSSGIRLSGSILVDNLTFLAEAQDRVNMAVGNG